MKRNHKQRSVNRKLTVVESLALKENPLALQTICIRLQKNLIGDLKDLAGDDGLGYQPYIRRYLTQHVRVEKRKRERQ